MLNNDILTKYLSRATGLRYADLRSVCRRGIEVKIANEGLESLEFDDATVGCRVLNKSYGVSSTNRMDEKHLTAVMEQAIEHANAEESDIKLAQVKPEEGSYSHIVKHPPSIDEAQKILKDIRSMLVDIAGMTNEMELVLSYTEYENALVTSEGTNIHERFGATSLTIELNTKNGTLKKVIGGKGGIEVLEHKDLKNVLAEFVARAKDSTNARQFSPLESGKRFRVILDSEAAAMLAKLISIMIEAESNTVRSSLNDLEIVDNPTIPGAYGSFVWDDEGVRGKVKILFGKGQINRLHTRFTATEDEPPGNAKGIRVKPSVSNIYISPSDWHADEIIEDTREGILMKGVSRAEMNVSKGIVELEPIVAYMINRHELEALKNVMLIDSIRNIIERIDAIGRLISLIPDTEKISTEGAPYIRIDGARCVYTTMR